MGSDLPGLYLLLLDDGLKVGCSRLVVKKRAEEQLKKEKGGCYFTIATIPRAVCGSKKADNTGAYTQAIEVTESYALALNMGPEKKQTMFASPYTTGGQLDPRVGGAAPTHCPHLML